MGFVSLTRTEKTGMFIAFGATGMKPDLIPVTFDMTLLMGTQGLPNVDCVTVWFCVVGCMLAVRQSSCGNKGRGEVIPLGRTGIEPKIQGAPGASQGSIGDCCRSRWRLARPVPLLCLVCWRMPAKRPTCCLRPPSLLSWRLPWA